MLCNFYFSDASGWVNFTFTWLIYIYGFIYLSLPVADFFANFITYFFADFLNFLPNFTASFVTDFITNFANYFVTKFFWIKPNSVDSLTFLSDLKLIFINLWFPVSKFSSHFSTISPLSDSLSQHNLFGGGRSPEFREIDLS